MIIASELARSWVQQIAVGVLAFITLPVLGAVCTPPPLGSPCPRGGTATQGNTEPLPNLGIGNPVHLATGNKHQLDVDLPPNPHAPGLELVRHYNGLSTRSGALGANWSLSYDTQLQRRHGRWQVRQGDGSVRDAAEILETADGFIWPWPNGRRLRFDARGHLTHIRQGGKVVAHIHRHPASHPAAGLIHRVQAETGQALEFHYAEHQGQTVLASVQSPWGVFQYRYDSPPQEGTHRSARLTAVVRPDGMHRLYHYEPAHQSGNPYALTGISLHEAGEPAQRLTTWEYDRHGRVVSARQHGRAIPLLKIAYIRAASLHRAGHTRVSNSEGRQADFHFTREPGGDYRRLEAEVRYDAQGRLRQIHDAHLLRDPQGELTGLALPHSGWPGLRMHAHRGLRRYAWHSTATGTTEQFADELGRPISLRHENGDALQLSFDAQNRPVRVQASGGRPPRQDATHLQWRGHRLTKVAHPFETETRRLGSHGRVLERSVQRPAVFGGTRAHFRDAFEYDDMGRLSRHALPEGGALLYAWHSAPGRRHRLARLAWEDAGGHIQVVVDSDGDTPGYRYGNGLELLTLAPPGSHADTLLLSDGQTLLWRQTRRYDQAGRPVLDRHEYPGRVEHRSERLLMAYDARSRLHGALHQGHGVNEHGWYAWHGDGRLAAHRRDGLTTEPRSRHEPSGLPLAVGPYTLHYGPGRRLEGVSPTTNPLDAYATASGAWLAQYRHNAYGHRIMKLTNKERVHFLYLHDKLVAEARSLTDHAPPAVTRRYLHAGLTPVGMIEYPASGVPQLYAVHADLAGVPRLVTDSRRTIRWAASYSPLGRARQWGGDLQFPLRFPGQYEDTETGWHDNLLRTYLPETGHYLEPDPLGPLPGTDTFGYAAQQPWRYADPLGLLLFAFDGTRYDQHSGGNVWTLAQAYTEGAAHYHSGPGNSLFFDWDALVAWRASRILENQWQSLLTSLEHHPSGAVMPIDIIGFSRGAALARHFGNRIATHTQQGLFSVEDPVRGQITACVDLRFMGLFDTVAQFGIGGSHNHLYDFGIDPLWSWVSHAVALHEHRWTFPLTSASNGAAGNVVEAPFIGAHADIGGGLALYAPDATPGVAGTGSGTEGGLPGGAPDLAKVALQWMHWQAVAATADFNALEAADTAIDHPLLRDMRAPLLRMVQDGDRSVTDATGAAWLAYQSEHGRLGAAARRRVEKLIERLPDWRSQSGNIIGQVDMEGYSDWLRDTLGWAPE